MTRKWELQDAQARFGEVIKRAASEGPQMVTFGGAETAVVMSIDDYRRLETKRPSFKDYLLSGPILDDDVVDLINDRSRDTGREIDFS